MMSTLKRIALYAFLVTVAPLAILEVAARLLPVSSPPYLLPVSAQHPVPRFQPGVQYQYSWGADFSVQAVKRSNNFGYNLENYGVPPDIFVRSSPEDELRGLDRELLTAVQEALKLLANGRWQHITTNNEGLSGAGKD